MFKFKRTEVIPTDMDVPAADSTENTMPEAAGEQAKKKPLLSFRASAAFAFALCAMLIAVSQVTPVLASSGSSSVIDSGLVGELIDLVKQVAGLFSVFPINVFLIGALAGLAFALFNKAKHVAKG